MPVTVKPYWERALHRLRLTLIEGGMSERLRATSQERVIRYREHLDAAAVRAKYRSASFRDPIGLLPGEGVDVAMNYRAMLLDEQGRIVRSQKVTAAGDEEASVLAAGMVDAHAVDLWDGLRFIEHFASPRP